MVSAVQSNAGRVQDIPQSIVDALVGPSSDPDCDASLTQLRSRLLALSEFYRLDAVLAEVARLRGTNSNDAQPRGR